MTTEETQALVEVLNNGLKDKAQRAIRFYLDYDVNLTIVPKNCNGDWCVFLIEEGNQTTDQLTATPLLKRMFAAASIKVDVVPNDDLIWFWVKVEYDHSFHPGSNGLALMDIWYNPKTKQFGANRI